MREIDGHDLAQILENATGMPFQKGKPSVIIANTIKSKGLSFAEDNVAYHHWKITPQEIERAERDLAEIERSLGA